MERLIDNDLLIFPGPGICAGSKRQVALLGVIVIYLKEKIPSVVFLNEERISNKFGRQIGDILRAKERIYPSLQLIEMKRRIASIYAYSPLFPAADERNAASHANVYATTQAYE